MIYNDGNFTKKNYCHINCLSGLKKHLNSMKILKKSDNKEHNEGCFLDVDVKYPEKLHKLHKDLPLQERIKIEKVEKLVVNLPSKREYIIHIRNLKQALNHALFLKKVYRVIKCMVKTLY